MSLWTLHTRTIRSGLSVVGSATPRDSLVEYRTGFWLAKKVVAVNTVLLDAAMGAPLCDVANVHDVLGPNVSFAVELGSGGKEGKWFLDVLQS